MQNHGFTAAWEVKAHRCDGCGLGGVDGNTCLLFRPVMRWMVVVLFGLALSCVTYFLWPPTSEPVLRHIKGMPKLHFHHSHGPVEIKKEGSGASFGAPQRRARTR